MIFYYFGSEQIARITLFIIIPLCLFSLTASADYQQDILADWLLQEKYIFNPTKNITTQLDAAGACDGVIDGKWGFHTNLQKNPWWQVDFGGSFDLDKVRIFYDHVWKRYREGASTEGQCTAATSELLKKITDPEGHHDIKLDDDAMERLITWLDAYGQKLGAFDKKQEQQLIELKQKYAPQLTKK